MANVSVVIVAYNKGDTLAEAIESVLAQSYRDFEILVVDDGSTDDTAARVRPYRSRVRYLVKPNGGTGSARNLGIAEAQGRYVAFLDGDDLWLPRKLEVQMEAFRGEPEIVAVQCGAYCVDSRLRVLEERSCRPARDTLIDFLLFRNLPAFSSAVVIRGETLRTIGGFGTDLVILSDWDMACRLSRAGTLRSIPVPLVLYRHYPDNQSRDVGIHLEPGVRLLTRFFSDPSLGSSVRARAPQVWARFYAMLAGGYFRNREWAAAFAWAGRALWTSPRVLPYLSGLPVRMVRRFLWAAHRPRLDRLAFPFLETLGA